MIRHILLLQPRPDTTAEEIEACRVAATGLVGQIEGVINCHWGVNLVAAERHEGLTHGFSMDLTDLDALRAYGPHPRHQPVAALVRAAFPRIVVLDIELT